MLLYQNKKEIKRCKTQRPLGVRLHWEEQLYKPELMRGRGWGCRVLTDGRGETQGSEQRVVIRPGHLAKARGAPGQPWIINPMTGTADSEEHRHTQKRSRVNHPSRWSPNQDGRTSKDSRPDQRVRGATHPSTDRHRRKLFWKMALKPHRY